MTSKVVNSPLSSARTASRYSSLARVLTEEIESGRFGVGHLIPTEAELQRRFDVSRHTVREALRDLKDRGLILARAGVGTVVRARTPNSRFMQGVGTLQDLVQFAEATQMRTVKRRIVVADEELAGKIAVKPGQELHEAFVLRLLPKQSIPVTSMHVYVRPEYGNVLDMIDESGQPVFALIERQHGVRIVEVRQQIVAVTLDAAEARVLKARTGACALHISRQYFDSHDRMVMASVGLYPSDRFSHNTQFRIQSADAKES
jgi:DNA-binding GntR family transcriptional regulator